MWKVGRATAPAPVPAYVRSNSNGVPPVDVAELIGDTEEMVRKHYSKWVPDRQARLSAIVQSALSSTPRRSKRLRSIGGGAMPERIGRDWSVLMSFGRQVDDRGGEGGIRTPV